MNAQHNMRVARAFCVIKNPKGHTVVELSLLIVPFMMVLLAVMEFGWFFLHQHSLQFAVREGMRLALVGEILNDDQGNPMTREDSIMQTVKEKAAWSMNPNDVLVQFAPLGANYEDPDDFSDPSAAPNAGNPADYMRIQATYDHAFFSPLIGHLFDDDCTDGCTIELMAQATYRNELFDQVI